ncbi:hypothetical protein ACFPRL_23165 [Pseudoclavibacter helvolus]
MVSSLNSLLPSWSCVRGVSACDIVFLPGGRSRGGRGGRERAGRGSGAPHSAPCILWSPGYSPDTG